MPDHDVYPSGAPCTDHSVAGKQRGLDGKTGSLFIDQWDLIETKQPKLVILEQVPNVLFIQRGRVIKILNKRANAAGYRLQYWLLDSRDYGSVSQRERLFVIGVRKDIYEELGPLPRPRKETRHLRNVSDVLMPNALRPSQLPVRSGIADTI